MFSKLALVLSLAILAVATPVPTGEGPHGGDGPANVCCTTTQSASSPSAQGILALLGVAVGSVTGMIGGNCSPITVSMQNLLLVAHYLSAPILRASVSVEPHAPATPLHAKITIVSFRR